MLLMLRAGVVAPWQVVGLADEYDARAASEVEPEAERLRAVAHQLRLVAIEHEAPAGAGAIGEVAFRRRQIRAKTAWLARQGDSDA